MPYSGNPELTAMWTSNPDEAARQVIAALDGAETLEDAADKLKVGRRTLYRWLREYPELAVARKTWGGSEP